MSHPAPTPDYTPNVEDLRAVAAFLRARSLDEAGAAGVMQSNKSHGAQVRVHVAKGSLAASSVEPVRKEVADWLDEHSPERFMQLSHELANLAEGLANAGVEFIYDQERMPQRGDWRVDSVWRVLTSGVRLWSNHPDFNPLWAKPL
ncbi:hypothetical protein [Streptomyces sp. NPDC058985]|uniref:hypothetical protein n=1 Tax=Streptomyces sp. NPDC058985 TaxID=3346684 RepID=UPI0036BB82C7